MECPYCKAENRDGVRYCGNCGKFIGSPPASSEATDTPNSAENVSRSLTPGSRLQGGRYVIKRVLGQGGMGAALLATDLRLDSKPVVIKELLSESVDPRQKQEDVRNFKREVATLAHIDHPLVPNVTDHFQEGTRYFMVQEYVDGENLEERLKRTNQPMMEREALICASEMLDVLDYLSQQTPPLVHRDIKPANIIIGAKDRRAHLVDFGIARAEANKNAQRSQTSALGTPGYAPPEQYQGNADPRSDLYALSATLHHLLTNRDPRNHAPFNYPPARSINAYLSPDIEQILMRGLNNDVNQRYQSAAAMKHDIDNILRLRYGISGNIDSYTLGASGTMNTLSGYGTFSGPTAAISNQPTQASAHPQTPGPVSMTPVQPLYQATPPPPPTYPYQSRPYSNLLSQPGNPTPQSLPQKKRRGLLLPVIIILLILLVVGGGLAGLVFLRNSTTGSTGNGLGVAQIGNESIGISDGRFIFDTARTDGSLKEQAAQQLSQGSGNISSAIALLNQAIAEDPRDPEAHIYLEDLRVVDSGSPYVTIVVATMLSRDSNQVGVGRDDLQGAYVAQKEYNDGAKLPGGVQVRLLIANSGTNSQYATSDVDKVAQQIEQLAQSDKTFVGVMGWPYSSQSIEGLKTLAQAHIPIVSQTASTDALTGASPYFFRVAPSNQTQGINGAIYAEQSLHAKSVAMFYDPNNPYSQSLAQDFMQRYKADGNTIIVEEKYTVGKPQTLPTALQDALAHSPDLIYFAGYSADVSTLLTNLPSGNMPVMGGDALYELGGYPSSARAGFSHLHFTAFAYPDEWDVLGYGSNKPTFFSEYPSAYDPGGQHPGSYGYSRADNDVILSYDAVVALMKGSSIALGTGTKTSITPQELRDGLTKVNGANAFQGVSGQVAFNAQGDPVNKAIVILYVDPQGHIKMDPTPLGHFLK